MITFPKYQQDRLNRYGLFMPEDFNEATVLDLGCNEGQVMRIAQTWGAIRVLGVDYDPSFSGPPDIICADLDEWNTDERFDVVLLLSVTKWVKDPIRLARLAESLTKKVLYYEGHQQQYEPDDFAQLFAGSHLHWTKLGEVPVARPFYRGVRKS